MGCGSQNPRSSSPRDGSREATFNTNLSNLWELCCSNPFLTWCKPNSHQSHTLCFKTGFLHGGLDLQSLIFSSTSDWKNLAPKIQLFGQFRWRFGLICLFLVMGMRCGLNESICCIENVLVLCLGRRCCGAFFPPRGDADVLGKDTTSSLLCYWVLLESGADDFF